MSAGPGSGDRGIGGGPAPAPPLPARANPPGRPSLDYRAGTFESFTRAMLDRLVLALQGTRGPAEVDGSRARPIRINLGGPDHWLTGLVKSWATVADVLTFYQERILQEGYLRTAVEDRSVHELAQMIGYRRRPGVGGSADLAIRIAEVQGLPQDLELPAGLVVRSVPPPGSEPQVFETVERLRARAAWNLLRPTASRREVPPTLEGGGTSLALQGTASGLTAGQGILISGTLAERRSHWFRIVTRVRIEPGDPPATEIAWAGPLAPDLPAASIGDLEVLALRQQTGLFGYNAPRWQDLPPEVRRQAQVLGGGVLVQDAAGWRRPANQGLPVASAVRCLAIDDGGDLFAGTAADGVLRSSDGGRNWKPARRGLLQADVQALAVGAEGTLYAGTSAGGVYRSTDHGEIWEPANGGAQLGASRRRWLPHLRPPPGPLPSTTVRALAVAPWGAQAALFAGTDSGLYASRNSGRSWRPANRGLPGTDSTTGATDLPVGAVAAAPDDGLLFIGTARGVFKSTDGGRRWRPANRGLPATDPFSGVSATGVQSLVAYRDRRRHALYLVAATSRGLFRSTDGGERWQRAEKGFAGAVPAGEDLAVLALAVLDDPIVRVTRLYAGTAETVWTSLDHGESWTRSDPGAPGPVGALAVGRDGRSVAAATPLTGFAGEWPGFRLRPGMVDLDSVVPGVVAGGWIALRPGSTVDPAAVEIFEARKVSTVQRRDFHLVANVTRIEVDDPTARLATLDLRDTRAYVHSEPLPLAPRIVTAVPVAIGILRAALLAIGDEGRKVVVVGKTLPRHLAVESDEEGGSLLSALRTLRDELAALDGAAEVGVRIWIDGNPATARPDLSAPMRAGELDEMLATLTTGPHSRQAIQRVFALGNAAGTPAGRLTIHVDLVPMTVGRSLLAGELAQYLETSTSESVPGSGDAAEVEVVRIPGGEAGRLLALDASTLQIHCNVVTACEGVTVQGEVLGDGDATEANQAFTLAQPPAFLLGAGFPRSDLQVKVQGERWREVGALSGETGESHAYRLRLDQEGRATVIFGDGRSGARLPTGPANVTATYRTGMSSRRVPPGGLSLLATRPLGLDAVANPLPSTRGAPPESADEIRRSAPRQVRLFGRIVSLRDYGDYARDFPGVAKAEAWGLVVAGSPAVQITVAPEGGGAADDGLLGELRAGIEAARGHPSPVFVQGYRRVAVAVAARIKLAGGATAAEWDGVARRVRQALADRFGFDASGFGGGINAEAVISAMQGVPGVRAVDFDRMTWPGMEEDGEAGCRERRARPPAWDPESRQLRAAELVIIGDVDLLPVNLQPDDVSPGRAS
jgi:hypothetical protein